MSDPVPGKNNKMPKVDTPDAHGGQQSMVPAMHVHKRLCIVYAYVCMYVCMYVCISMCVLKLDVCSVIANAYVSYVVLGCYDQCK